MKTLEDALLKVQEDPAKYLGKKSLRRLDSFIFGYFKSQVVETGAGP